jgi:hypothetical protein
MNYIKHLTAYFDHVVNDHSLNPTHISLYIAFFQFWNLNRFQNPISISRDETMRISKICSKATYHKCVRELHEKGYIIYEPSYNPFKGSIVHMLNLSEQLKPTNQRKKTNSKIKQVNEQVVNKQCTASGTGTEQALVSSINYINSTNNTNLLNLDKQQKIKKNSQFKNYSGSAKDSRGKNDKKHIPPDWENVLQFFKEKNATELDAQKFYNHFQSNGWLVGGKSKMKDWQAAARNWLLNAEKFNPTKESNKLNPKNLNVSNSKDYGEPL